MKQMMVVKGEYIVGMIHVRLGTQEGRHNVGLEALGRLQQH